MSAGTQQVQQAGQSMQAILDNVNRVQDSVGEVNAATNAQSLGATQIKQSVAQLDQMTQQNVALAEESSAAAAHLNQQATQLRQTVEAFRLNGMGATATYTAQAAPALAPAGMPAPRRGTSSLQPAHQKEPAMFS